MSQDSDLEKTEQPTPKRREDARRDGQLPQSKELSTAVALLGAAAMVQLAGPWFGTAMFNTFASGMSGMFGSDVDPHRIIPYLQRTSWAALGATAPILLTFAGVALFVGGAQARGNLTTKPLEPKWERLDVVKNARNLYGKKPWVELARSIIKLLVVITALRWALSTAWPEIVSLTQQAPAAAIALAHGYVVRLLATAGAAYIVLGLLDYGYQIWENEQKMRMTQARK
jgi:flagellar biosynthesis protein FlhB